MTKANVKILLFCIVSISIWGCKVVSGEEPVPYPKVYEEKSLDELTALNQEYQQRNEDKICSTLNEYGFTGFSRVLFPNDINPCLSRSAPKIELPFSDSIVEQARKKLIENKEFTNVNEVTKLEVVETLALNGCTICEGPDINNVPLEWKITFANQYQEDVEVRGTGITVHVDNTGVNRIWGNWFDVADPGLPVIGYLEAQQKFIGRTLSYENESGGIVDQNIEASDMKVIPDMIFLPIKTADGLELRKCWRIPISKRNTEVIKWTGFVDIIAGEVVLTETI